MTIKKQIRRITKTIKRMSLIVSLSSPHFLCQIMGPSFRVLTTLLCRKHNKSRKENFRLVTEVFSYSATTPLLIFSKSSAAISSFSLIYVLAASRPWAILLPLYSNQEPLFLMRPNSTARSRISPSLEMP